MEPERKDDKQGQSGSHGGGQGHGGSQGGRR